MVSLDDDDIKQIDTMNENYRFFDGLAFTNPNKGYNKIF